MIRSCVADVHCLQPQLPIYAHGQYQAPHFGVLYICQINVKSQQRIGMSACAVQ